MGTRIVHMAIALRHDCESGQLMQPINAIMNGGRIVCIHFRSVHPQHERIPVNVLHIDQESLGHHLMTARLSLLTLV